MDFTTPMKRYSPEEIRQIRTELKESRYKFGMRFFLSDETIKNWELGRKNPSGPALRIMQVCEDEAASRRKERNEVFRASMDNKRKRRLK